MGSFTVRIYLLALFMPLLAFPFIVTQNFLVNRLQIIMPFKGHLASLAHQSFNPYCIVVDTFDNHLLHMIFNISHHQAFGNKKFDLEIYQSKVEDDNLLRLYENFLCGGRRKNYLFNVHKMNGTLNRETIKVGQKNSENFTTNSKFVEHFGRA